MAGPMRQEAEALLAQGQIVEGLAKARAAVQAEETGAEGAAALTTLAAAYVIAGKPKLALESAKAAQSMAASLGDGPKAAALLGVVRTYLGYKQIPVAILNSEATLANLGPKVGSAKPMLAELLRTMPGIDSVCPSVDTLLLMDSLEAAAEVAAEALEYFRGVGDKTGEATALYLSTYVQSERRTLRDPLAALTEVMGIFQAAGASRDVEMVQKDILSYHASKADKEKCTELKNQVTTGDALLRVAADTYFTMRMATEAQQMVVEATTKFREAGNKPGEAAALRAMVNIHLANGDMGEAMSVADQIVGVIEDTSGKAAGFLLLAAVRALKDEEADEVFNFLFKAQGHYSAAGNPAGEAQAYIAIAELYLNYRLEKEARDRAQSAADVAKGAGLTSLEASAMCVIVNVILAKDQHHEAGTVASAALAKAREAKNVPAEVTILKALVQLRLSAAAYDVAMDSALDLANICAASGDKDGEADAKMYLANACLNSTPGSQQGIDFAKEALALCGPTKDFRRAQILYNLANGYFNRFELEEGLKHAQEALFLFRAMGDFPNEERLKECIEEARTSTFDSRKATGKLLTIHSDGLGKKLASGPQVSPVSESLVAPDALAQAVASRKYWGVPKMLKPDLAAEAAERLPSHVIIWGQNQSDNCPSQNCIEFFDMCAAMASEVAKIPIVVPTFGVHARFSSGEIGYTHFTGLSAQTMWGGVRAIKTEMPTLQIYLMDFSAQNTMAAYSKCLRMPAGVVESSYYQGARWEPQIVQVDSLFRRGLEVDNLQGGGTKYKNSRDPAKSTKFMRKSFTWMGPSAKIDYVWYRQDWKRVAAAYNEPVGGYPEQPCRLVSAY